MSAPAGWYPDPHDPRVHRFWDGSAWVGAPAPAQVPRRSHRGRRFWWLGAAVVVVAVVVVSVVAAAGGGGSGGAADHQAFCSDLDGALPGLYHGNVVHIGQGGVDPYTSDEKALMRAAISSANHLAGEAPDVPKHYLQGLARGLNANLTGREDSAAEDDPDVQLGQLNAWEAVNC